MKCLKNKSILSFFFIIYFFLMVNSIEIKVGVYYFPPFVFYDENNNIKGITVDLIREFNRIQDEYRFIIVKTDSEKRYEDFKNGLYDMIMFENKKWGWNDFKVDVSNIFLEGGEIFICLNKNNRDVFYMRDIVEKKISGIRGYHYQFADFISDPDKLKERFNIVLTNSHKDNIMAVINDKVDVSVVTRSYLLMFLKENPVFIDKILISDYLDQKYEHTILLNEKSIINIENINQLLNNLLDTGVVNKILMEYGIL